MGKNNSRKKTNGAAIVALLLVIVLLIGLIGGAVYIGVRSKGFSDFTWIQTSSNGDGEDQNSEDQNGGEDDPDGESAAVNAVDGEGNALVSGETYEIPTSMTFYSVSARSAATEEYASFSLTATITPSYAVNKSVDWSVRFKDSENEWAKTHEVTDYITVTPSSDGSSIADVVCKEAFGAQIEIVASSQQNPQITAACTVDFARRIESATLKIGNETINLGGDTALTIDIVNNDTQNGGAVVLETVYTDVYTVADTFTQTVSFTHDAGGNGHNGYFAYYVYQGAGISYGISYDDIENAVGAEIYFDLRLFSDFNFNYFRTSMPNGEFVTTLSPFAEEDPEVLIGYQESYGEYPLWTVTVSIVGAYSSYTAESDLYWSANGGLDVTDITIDQTGIVV